MWAAKQPSGSITSLTDAAAAIGVSTDSLLIAVNPSCNGPGGCMLVWDGALSIQVGGSPPHLGSIPQLRQLRQLSLF